MERSRLRRRIERKSKQTLLFSLIGTITVLFLFFKFGLPFFINASLFISRNKNAVSSEEKSDIFIQPPVLNSTFEATNSAIIKVSGSALAKQTVRLYINGEFFDKKDVQENNSFEFTNIKLTPGDNRIKAKVRTSESKESDYSNEISVVYKKNAPGLTIDSPSDNASFSKDDSPIKVTGKTDPGVKVTINDYWAIVNANGNFSYSLPLQNGDNTLKIVAEDDAGNKTEITRKVKYSQ